MLGRNKRSGRAQQEASESAGSLQPILVDYFTRDGSTLMMRLLASSPQIAVGGGYPYEHKYFAYLYRWSRLIEKPEWPRRFWNGQHLATLTQEDKIHMMGPPPWKPRELFDAEGNDPEFSQYAYRMLWDEFSRRAAAQTRKRSKRGDADVKYYAEKHLSTWAVDLEGLPPVRVLALLRDPRDTYVSIISFSRKRREEGKVGAMGQRPGETAKEWLDRHLERQRERLRWILAALEDETMPVVRYEDLVLDLEGVSRRLEEVLGVELDPAAVAADEKMRRTHVSSDSPEASIGRWRREMKPHIVSRFNDELGDEMEALGFDVSTPDAALAQPGPGNAVPSNPRSS